MNRIILRLAIHRRTYISIYLSLEGSAVDNHIEKRMSDKFSNLDPNILLYLSLNIIIQCRCLWLERSRLMYFQVSCTCWAFLQQKTVWSLWHFYVSLFVCILRCPCWSVIMGYNYYGKIINQVHMELDYWHIHIKLLKYIFVDVCVLLIYVSSLLSQRCLFHNYHIIWYKELLCIKMCFTRCVWLSGIAQKSDVDREVNEGSTIILIIIKLGVAKLFIILNNYNFHNYFTIAQFWSPLQVPKF